MLVEKHILLVNGREINNDSLNNIYYKLKESLIDYDLANKVEVIRLPNIILSIDGPVLIVYPDQIFYNNISTNDIEEICSEHLINSRVYTKLELRNINEEDSEKLSSYANISFYNKQLRIALRNCGFIDPSSIEEYIARSGYFALAKALTEMTQLEVIDLITESGLKGRGGGGFPTGVKWRYAYLNNSDQKYMICNADEGDPGAFMDRAILEGDPHSVIEAMAIAGYAIGASQGFIYIRAEYPLAVERLNYAIKQAYKNNLLGSKIFNTNFSFDLEIRLGAGAFVCGEETALIASIEGERGMPRNKPPFPAEKGLWGKPSVINNVETFANIPIIMLNGAEWFNQIGTEKSKGTKVFALGGKIKNTGLVEIPMGTTLREVIFDIGGGIANNKKFKAVQTGGPSGGCLTEEHLDTKIDYDNLSKLGSMMGSGGMIVMDENNCMVDVARFFLEFTVDESCGKCTPCREGTKRLLEILEKITEGRGTLADIDQLEKLALMIKDASLCGLGQTAPNPVLSTLANFRHEYISHVVDKKCSAGVCKELMHYKINDNCIGCGKCKRNCPVDCITGDKRQIHIINQLACIKCGTCISVCPTQAVLIN